MEQLILMIYVLLAAAMIGLILIQQGRGADMGASFGSGASQTVFGSGGSASVLTRTTAVLATLFFLTSVGLAVMAKHQAEAARDAQIPVPAVTETRQAPKPPGDLPAVTHDIPAAAPASESGASAPDLPEIPAEGAGNPASQPVPSAPAP